MTAALPPPDTDGRTLPPAPMPPALRALVDPAKAGPGPRDEPAELAARVATLCQCGCGQPAPIARKTSTANGVRAGQRLRYVHGHNTRTRTPRPLPAPQPERTTS